MKKLLFILLLTIPFFGFGQGWEKTYGSYGGDMGYSLDITSDSGFIVTGYTSDSVYNSLQTFLIKINSQGDSIWSNSFGDTLDDRGYSVKQTTDGGYIITGRKMGPTDSSKVYLIKTDNLGNQQWEKTYNRPRNSFGNSVQQTTDGGYIICGWTDVTDTSNITDDRDGIWLIKTDSYGDTIWTKIYHNENNQSGWSIQKTTDGGYIICGNESSNFNRKGYLMKINSSGDTIWTKKYGPNRTYTYSVKQTTDGGYVFCGRTSITINTNPSNIIYQSFLVKTDSQGDTTWTRTYDGGMGKSVIQTIDGGYMFYTGLLDTSLIKLIKIDSQGNTTWTKVYQGNVGGNFEIDIKQTHDGGYVFCGGRLNSQGKLDLLIIKTDGNGNVTSTFNIPTLSSKRKIVKIVDILGRETKPQTNTPFIEIYDDGSTDKKLIIEK